MRADHWGIKVGNKNSQNDVGWVYVHLYRKIFLKNNTQRDK